VIGLLGDILLGILFRAWKWQQPSWRTSATATAQMGAILVLMFGGKWGTETLLSRANLAAILPSYISVLALVITPVGLFVLYGVLFSVPGHGRKG
jgi:hypothetical protein